MKYVKKVFSVFLSLFIMCTLVFDVHVHAENEGEQPLTIETNESNSNADENYGGIISDDANDVPSYQSDVQAYSEIPSSYQLDKTKYPDVRDQGSYGTCWAFAALGLSEFNLINKGLADKTIDLSELQLAYYTYNSAVDPLGGTSGDQSTYYNDAADYSYLNRGGMYEYAVRRLSQWSGAVNESDVPYNTSNINSVLNNGLSSEYAYSKDVAHLENAYVMSLKNNTDDVKKAIMNNGAVGVQYYHSDSYLLWNSTQQLWTYYSPTATGGGHNVMIVGWDDNFSKDNFVGDKPSNDGAWLIRNSWGFTQSYFWMSYENQSLLDAAWAFDMNAANNYDNNYQLDGGIDTYNVSNTICQYKTYSNVFTVQKKDGVSSEKLDAVSLSFTHVANVNYKIEIYTDLKSDNPYSGTKQESATTEGSTTYAGLYTISLNSSIQLKPGTSFAVVVTTDSYSLDYEQGITWELDGTKIWDSPVSLNSGKSFYGNSNYQWAWYWGNFCIKAFTTNNTATCTNHTWNEGTITTSPTCTEKGVKTFTCTTCGATKTEEVAALGHDYSDTWTTDIEATCTTEGSKSHHCTRDGCSAKTGDTSISKTNHEYASEWTIDKEATCQEEGSKSHHCIHCDAKTDVTTISKTDHNWNFGTVTKEATCTTAGVKTYTCKTCKKTKTETINALGHNYSTEWTTDVEATCTSEGSKSHHCTRDGCNSKTGTTSIAALGHNYSTEWTIDEEATCTQTGTKSHHCTRKNCNSKTGETEIAMTEHNWNDGVVTKSATCNDTGIKTYTCKDCSETRNETIKALGHDYSTDYTIDKEATCTEIGSKSRHCKHAGCNEKIDVTSIPAKGHSWDNGVVTKAATCTDSGIIKYTCKTCKKTDTQTISALGHNYSSSWTTDKNATCTSEGSKSHHCTRCNSKKDVTVISKLNHNWNSGVVTKKATYNQNGNIQYTCKTCGTQKNESIAKLSSRTESITYRTHVQDYGWQSWKTSGESSGTSGQSKRLEGINIKISNKSVDGNIMYRTHVQNIGWQGWKSNGDMSGTSGQSLRLEAIQIKLTDELANSYDIYYRVHAQDYGWLDWAKNGESAGTEGKSKRLEAIQIKLVPKGNSAPGSTSRPFVFDMVSYRTHVQDYGWQSYVSDGTMSGTSGKSKRLEGINIKLSSSIDGGIQYRTHVQDYGWQNWVQNNQMSGTSGQSKRLEAIQIRLTGNIANQYDVYYRVHCQDFGWLGWAKNGESSGSEGYSKRLEGIQVVLVKKGSAAPGNTANHFYKR